MNPDLFGVSDIPLDDENRFHLLRHFSGVGTEYLRVLGERLGKTVSELEARQQAIGSKFASAFAADPDDLWDILKGKIAAGAGVTIEPDTGSRYHICCTFPEVVGTDAVIALLPEENGFELELTMRFRQGTDGPLVPVVTLSEFPATRIIHVLIRVADGGPVLLTVFPGTYAPPFPDDSVHTPEELADYTFFWKTHALVESAPCLADKYRYVPGPETPCGG